MAAFYFGPDSNEAFIEECGPITDAMEEAYNKAMEIEVSDAARYTLADLVALVSGDDVNAMSARVYKNWCDSLVDETAQADRDHYYRTGLVVGTLGVYYAACN